jgi:predicted nucleic acid-binding protein
MVLILSSVPVTLFVTNPELVRPSVPVMTHYLDETVVARKAKARKDTAKLLERMYKRR